MLHLIERRKRGWEMTTQEIKANVQTGIVTSHKNHFEVLEYLSSADSSSLVRKWFEDAS